MSTKFLWIAGVPKCGTTWLAHELAQRPDCWFAPREMHVLDVEFLDRKSELDRHFRKADAFIGNIEVQASQDGREVDPQLVQRALDTAAELLAVQQNPESYPEYFLRRTRVMPELALVGDKTPAYCELSADHWQTARDRMLKAGFDPYLILSFRDPVERMISHYRMAQAIKISRTGCPRPDDPASVLEWMFKRRSLARSRYGDMVAAVQKVFPADRATFVLFEDLFTEEASRGICRFLDLEFTPFNYGIVQNPSRWAWECPIEVRVRLREELADAYTFGRAMFGAERIDRLWKNA